MRLFLRKLKSQLIYMEQLFETIELFSEKRHEFAPMDKNKFYIGVTYNPAQQCILDITTLGYFKNTDIFHNEFSITNYGCPANNSFNGFHYTYYTIKPEYTINDIHNAINQILRPSSEFKISELRKLTENGSKHFICKTKNGSYSYYIDVYIQLRKKQTVKASKLLNLFII